MENILQNYDEFASLKALQSVDLQDPQGVEAFRSAYNDIRDWPRKESTGKRKEPSLVKDVRRLIRSSIGNRAKESIIAAFVEKFKGVGAGYSF